MRTCRLFRHVLLAAACVLANSANALGQATYSDIWLVSEDVVTEGPFFVEQIGVGVLEAAYDPDVAYRVELRLYSGDELVDWIWTDLDPTHAFALGSVYTNSDIQTPPANCAIADHWIYRGLQRQTREWLGQTMATGPLGSYRSRYGLVGWDPDSEQWEYVRLNCTHGCQMPRKCIDSPGKQYIAGSGLWSLVPGSPGVVVCAGPSRPSDTMPPCHGPAGEQLGAKTGCKN